MGVADFIGGRGEAIAFMRLARIWRDDVDQPYFWPRYLGEKGQLFDFLVELVGAGDKTPGATDLVFLERGVIMTNEAKEQFIAEQVRAMATVFLTRRGDLTIVDTKQDTGVDLHIYINREDKPMRLTLGILLRGVPNPVSIEEANKLLGPTLGQFQGLRKFTYPVCLFLFTLRQEQAFFSWLAEPVETNGVPKLVHRTRADCVELTDTLLESILEQVVAWYDAVEAVLIA